MPDLLFVLIGAGLTLVAAYSLGRVLTQGLTVPRVIVFAAGSAGLSLAVYALLLAGAAGARTFLPLAALLFASGLVARPIAVPTSLPGVDPDTTGRIRLLYIVLAVYGVLYAVHALAPEIQPDAITYHLGLAAEYIRLRAFPNRVGFYEVLPQGLEMLFTFAFAFGKHSAAKLVHFAFLVATVPLIISIGRRIGFTRWVSTAAAVLYVASPVVGVSGTSAYNDAAFVFFSLAAFLLLWMWKESPNDRCLVIAGILAGFCYAIKINGLLIPALAFVFVAIFSKHRMRHLLLLSSGALVMIAPWVIRNLVLCGNPLAPFFNAWFPNPYFHVASETRLLAQLRAYHGLTLTAAPLELTIRGELLHGLLGPVFLLAPLAIFALRRRSGRVAALVMALMAAPWFMNMGTRFLMTALPWLALLILAALPRPVAAACVVFHAVVSWPAAVGQYCNPDAWRLRGFPARAALRIEPEKEYLQRNLWAYNLAEMVKAHTPRGARILDLVDAPGAYIDCELIGYWQTALGDRLGESFDLAARQERGTLKQAVAEWPEQSLRALRFRRTRASTDSYWGLHEVYLYRGPEVIRTSRDRELESWPNGSALAFDRNVATSWALRDPAQRGMYLIVNFGRPMPVSRATLVSNEITNEWAVEVDGMDPAGKWKALAKEPVVSPYPLPNLRTLAVDAMRREAIRYVLARPGDSGYGVAARALADNTRDWGLERVGYFDGVSLYVIP